MVRLWGFSLRLEDLNAWDLTPAQAVRVQKVLAGKVRGGRLPRLRTVLGLDVSYRRTEGSFTGGGVLLSIPAMEPLDSWRTTGNATFPYVPGLLSFREIPPLLPILEAVPRPDLILVDGHGIAHPRGLGLASHVGLITRVPTIGCAKSLLVGHCDEPGPDAGEWASVHLNGRKVGYALRSRRGCKPLFISPGHLLDPEEALNGVLMCLKGYRLPEPIRLADILTRSRSQESECRIQEKTEIKG